ncbi:MAG: cupin domain-containing protein [Bacteroidota bacterium]
MSYTLVTQPSIIPVPDNKLIEEYVGHVNTKNPNLSVAHMIAPAFWTEPYQTPEFDEVTIMIRGKMMIEIGEEVLTLSAGEVIFINKGTKVRYSNPFNEENEYWAVCTPAFHPEQVHRES